MAILDGRVRLVVLVAGLMGLVAATLLWSTAVPTRAAGGVAVVAAGDYHSCAVTATGGLKCWGRNQFGQLGDATTTARTRPVDVSGLSSGVIAVSGGNAHTCALTAAGSVSCWGRNAHGELGDGTTTDRITPVEVSGLTAGVAAVSAGIWHTCALTTAGGVTCWGNNSYGQLGDGQACGTTCTTPVDVTQLSSGVAAVSVGSYHTCALTSAGGVKCWGSNEYGELGDGQACGDICSTPVDLSGLTSAVASVSAGGAHNCALTNAGGIKCWGYNAFGQLGDGQACGTPCTTAVDVSGLTSGISAVSSGLWHTCGLTTAGGLKCWGWNNLGRLGDGQACGVICMTPVEVKGLSNGVATVSAGGEHTCALTSPFGPTCWGYNNFGQVGDGSTTDRTTPRDVLIDTEGDGCPDPREVQTSPGSQFTGGLRDPKNPWDYFNPTKDGQNRIDDILRVMNQYFEDEFLPSPPNPPNTPNPNYTPTTDRTLVGPNVWNLGPPNGQQRVDDILHAVNQYFHDCA